MSEKRRCPIALKQGDEIPPTAVYKNSIWREEEIRQVHGFQDVDNQSRQVVQVSKILLHIYEVDIEVFSKLAENKKGASVKRQNEIY